MITKIEFLKLRKHFKFKKNLIVSQCRKAGTEVLMHFALNIASVPAFRHWLYYSTKINKNQV
ncbi:hypothetical protein COO59_20120 [Mixta theicola]|uniref:Uncharacterized protein n=1 Tax=Mixta theicola TaxID=1458355 RepID=A0A2K1Q4H3_9GAMM|nr:hypothetical protein COO59_20120 [Mixta theicola]GLR09036.1 hypothetical protein GCM10007905_17560 [Mixta theicola]